MNLEFNIENFDKYEKRLIPEFCRELTNSIIHDVKINVKESKFQSREKDILDASFIEWYKKPELLKMYNLGILIANSIKCYRIDENLYSIKIDRKQYMPYSRTKLDVVARFLDKGDLTTPPMNFISSVFNKYREDINKYWKSFVSIKLGRVETREVIKIK